MTGVMNLDGILGTDIFCKLGFEMMAAALPGEMAWFTVMGLNMAPDFYPLFLLLKSETKVLYWPGPGFSGEILVACTVVCFLLCAA